MEHKMLFEHLMLDVFKCKRAELFFANSDHYEGAEKHIEETRAFMLCALLCIKETLIQHGLEDLIQRVGNVDCPTKKQLDEVLESLSKAGIVTP